MTVFSSTISSIFSILGSSLQLSAIFPAAVFLAANYIFVLPFFQDTALYSRLRDLEGGWQAVVILATTAIIGYTLTALNIPIIRLFEGYPFQDSLVGKLLLAFQKFQRDSLLRYKQRIEDLSLKIIDLEGRRLANQATNDDLQQLRQYEQQLEKLRKKSGAAEIEAGLLFPSDDFMLPTGLGNIIAAFEEYPRTHYNMDAVMLWPRLLPLLDKQGYAAFVERQKIPFDFLLNLTVLISIFALEYVYTYLYFIGSMPVWEVLGFGLIIFVLYRIAVTAAYYWGGTVVVAFDLYRKYLWQALDLRPPDSLDKEKEVWNYISRFMIYKDEEPYWKKYYEPQRSLNSDGKQKK